MIWISSWAGPSRLSSCMESMLTRSLPRPVCKGKRLSERRWPKFGPSSPQRFSGPLSSPYGLDQGVTLGPKAEQNPKRKEPDSPQTAAVVVHGWAFGLRKGVVGQLCGVAAGLGVDVGAARVFGPEPEPDPESAVGELLEVRGLPRAAGDAEMAGRVVDRLPSGVGGLAGGEPVDGVVAARSDEALADRVLYDRVGGLVAGPHCLGGPACHSTQFRNARSYSWRCGR